MTSLTVVEQATNAFFSQFFNIRMELHQFSSSLRELKVLDEVEAVENAIKDGNMPFPEDSRSLRTGISVEFW